MRRVIFSLLFVIAAMLPGTAAVAAQGTDCADLETYLQTVDAAVIEHTMTLVQSEEWIEAAEAASAVIQEGGDLENITEDALAPVIELWSIPAQVLDEIPDDEIPADALALHESAGEHWSMMAELLAAIGRDGPGAIFMYIAEVDRVTNENWSAQESVRSTCADVVAGYEDQLATLTEMFSVMDSGDLSPIIEVTAEDLEGLGVMYLFFADEDDVTATPAS